MRIDRLLTGAGAVLLTIGLAVMGAGPAGATFAGGSGNVAFVAICSNQVGQPVWSVNPNGSPPPLNTCPGGAAPNYTQSTAGSTDSMPYFSSNGATLYFASNRAGNFQIYYVAYPPTVMGAQGSQTDGAVAITNPSGANDYAPTVSADGSLMTFIRCNSANVCLLYKQSPIVGGTPTMVPTAVNLAVPDNTSGAASRPEIDPTNADQVLYVGTDSHIHLLSLGGHFAERDLTVESAGTGQSDAHPDWDPTGTTVVFDSSRVPPSNVNTGAHFIWTLTGNPAVATSLWGTADPGLEIEPIFSPVIPAPGHKSPMVWTKVVSGSNIQEEYSANGLIGGATEVAGLTQNRTNNSQPAWQPLPGTNPVLPEAPYVVLLPGGGLLLAGLVLMRQRRKQTLLTA